MIKFDIEQTMDAVKILAANCLLVGNSFVQWVSDADTILKLIGTIIALPVAFYSAKSFYWSARTRKAEALKKEKELSKHE